MDSQVFSMVNHNIDFQIINFTRPEGGRRISYTSTIYLKVYKGGIVAKKRVSRSRKRQLEKPDKFISFSARFLEFLTKYKVHALSAMGVIFTLIIIIFSNNNYLFSLLLFS